MKHRYDQDTRLEAQADGQRDKGYRLPVNCFRCSEGCVHLEYGNIVFTFTQSQFRALAEVIGKVNNELESERATQDFSHYDESLVM